MAKSTLTREEFAKFIEEQGDKLSEFLQPFMRAGIRIEISHVPGNEFHHEQYISRMHYGDPAEDVGRQATWQFNHTVPLFAKDVT